MLTASELILRHAALRTDTATNGGRMSKNAVAAGSPATILRDWRLSEVQNGGTQYRKVFLHVASIEGKALVQAGVHLLGPSTAGDIVTLFAGGPSDTQAAIPAAPAEYGAGTLQGPAAAGATGLSVVLEADDLAIFHAGDRICVLSGDGYEYHEGVSVTLAAGLATITLAAGDMLARDYPAGAAVASVLPLGDIRAAVTTVPATTASGTVDAARITADAIGGIDQAVTLTFTSSTAFSAVSDVLGSLGAGNISTEFAPANGDFSRPYFRIAAGALGGVWAAGEIVRFATAAAARGLWVKGRLPAGSAPAGDDAYSLRLIGGSN